MDIFPLKNRLYLHLRGKLLAAPSCGGRLPPERELAQLLNVSRNTLRGALERLEAEGLLARQSAAGTTFLVPGGFSAGSCFLFCIPERPRNRHVRDSIFQGALAAAAAFHAELHYCRMGDLTKIPLEEFRALLRESRCRGIILFANFFKGDEPFLNMVKRSSFPAALVYCREKDAAVTGLPAVCQCDRESWLAALRCLVETGHRRIVTLTLPGESVRECFSDREYSLELGKLGLDPDRNPVIKCNLAFHEIHGKLAPLFNSGEPPDAVLCYSDYWALEVYRVLRSLKKRIPEDVSVMGYCGSLDSDFISPKLTTVAIGYGETARMAMELLVNPEAFPRGDGGTPPLLKTPFTLCERESVRVRDLSRGARTCPGNPPRA